MFSLYVYISYSQGQFGGVRAAVGLRTPLSELGCLPVSAMIHIPHAHQQFNANGRILRTKKGEEKGEGKRTERGDGERERRGEGRGGEREREKEETVDEEEEERFFGYASRMISQVEWWAHAAKQYRKTRDPFDQSPPFQSNPSQRNAPR